MGDFFPPYSAPSDREIHLCLDGEVVRNVWRKWEVHPLVLLSFSIQVVLFIFAGFRRRTASRGLRFLLWLAYLLADSVATYTLGHLFVTTSCSEQRLQAFWAPFLLLHLGGQDTITAYALEDNRLWLRHLQALGVQVLAAAFILIGYFAAGGWPLVIAGVLMFLVGSLKYGERIWALRCANNDGMYSFLIRHCKQQPAAREMMQLHPIGHLQDHINAGRAILEAVQTDERVMHGAHTLLGISLCMFLDCEEETCRHNNGAISVLAYLLSDSDREIYRVIEMQLSLMYDMMYTKARVIHTWYGLCIRVISLLAIVATVILVTRFLKEENTYDAAITYVLLVGALIMEIASGFIAMVSTWTRHGWIWNVVIYLRRLVRANWWRRWSGLIGKFNMIECGAEMLSRDSDGISGLPLFQGKVSGLPPPEQVSDYMEISIKGVLLEVVEDCEGAAERLYTLNRNMSLLLNDNSDFGCKVIIWHIATHLILEELGPVGVGEQAGGLQEKIHQTKALSDYMMFLLSVHPDMLPGHTSRNLYTDAMKYLQDLGRYQLLDDYSDLQNGIKISMRLLAKGRIAHEEEPTLSMCTCMRGAVLAASMLERDRDGLLDEIFKVWVEMLCYAGSHCSRDAHARSLSRGGEFLTVVWLLSGHFADYERFKRSII